MRETVNLLLDSLGSHERVAYALGYTDRHYRTIRRKIERGETIPPRVSSLMLMTLQELRPTETSHAHG